MRLSSTKLYIRLARSKVHIYIPSHNVTDALLKNFANGDFSKMICNAINQNLITTIIYLSAKVQNCAAIFNTLSGLLCHLRFDKVI